ncbi:DUF3631 domain-containing protein [Methylocystis sp.]|uniref:DUF3631 domain-containing protein n=1 Tax=Methylocystis sp. TaxID=1911079 RepID=UPI0025F6B860|nr:DUF3631 domain-containing protein [Methylocystis sp.]
MKIEIENAFRAQILEKLGRAPKEVVADGKIRRFATSPHGRDDAGFYILHDDGLPAGSFGDWRTGATFKWRATSLLSPEELARRDELKNVRENREAEAYAKAAESARRRWSNAKPASDDHVYLKKKDVGAHGLREAYGALLIPICDGDDLISLQSINADGSKLFAAGGRTTGGYFLIGVPHDALVIAEGYATGASIYEKTGLPVVVAFNAGNLIAVAKKMRDAYPTARIIIAADDDYRTEAERGFNPGKGEAEKAASAVGGDIIVPPFDREAGDVGTDWNDFAAVRGTEKIKEAFDAAFAQEPRGAAPGAEIARLAALDPIAHDRERADAAKRLGCRVSTLDRMVAAVRDEAAEKKAVELCADIEPCAEPVDLADLLDDVRATIGRFIICDPPTATAAALWIAFTWIIEYAQVAPLAIVTAPEKGCGKSQLLDVIGRLSRRSLYASNVSPAALFRVIEARQPTLCVDEADAFMKDNDELRGVINSGHTRPSAYVLRVEGDDLQVKRFSTWGAKAIAGIGRLPETVMSRGIVLNLRRKLKTERVERLRHAETGVFQALARRLARFGEDYGEAIARARPQMPETLSDREQDNWEHLLAIADLAGGSWPKEARRAALTICGEDREDLSLGEQLLLSIRDAFEQDGADKLSREELLCRLVADEEGPWATWNKGKPMSAAQFRKRLAAFAIKTKKVRLDTYTTAQGFERRQFEDAWSRYLDGEGHASPGHPPQSWNNGTLLENLASVRSDDVPVPVSKSEHAGATANSSPVPKSKWNGDLDGTAKKPENLDCSTVPVPAPLSGEDMPHEIEMEL